MVGNIVSYKRARLSPSFVEMLTLGSMNWDFIQNCPNLKDICDNEGSEEEIEDVFGFVE